MSKNRIVIISVSVSVLVLGFLGLYFGFLGNNQTAVSLEFGKMDEVLLGKPFTADVTISNNGDKVLKNARLSLLLPEGVYFVGESLDQRVKEKFVGDIGPGSLSKESFNVIVTGGGGATEKLTSRLSYAIAPNDNVAFELETEADLNVSKPVLGLEMEAPEKVFSGENFQFKVKYRNDGGEDLKNLVLTVDYPPIFQFQESSLEPDEGNNLWRIGSLGKGEEKEFTISGSAVGVQGAAFDLKVSAKTSMAGQDYLLASKIATVAMAEAPLSVSILVNESSDYVAKPGDRLKYSLVYKNNSNFDLQNVTIKTKLTGEMFDFATIQSNGLFNLNDKTLLWGPDNLVELTRVSAHGEGRVEFEAKVKDSFLIRRLSDKNFSLRAEAEIQSANVPAELGAGKLLSVGKIETKIAGKVELDARAYFRDAASGILNNGNFPPKVGQATQYTIHWILKNYATDLSGVAVSAKLPPGVGWTGTVKGSGASLPSYDEGTHQVTWTINKVIATKGVIGDPMEAIFQVALTPNAAQVGQVMDLLSETQAQATDSFTGVTLSASDVKLDTNLPDDGTVPGSPKTVQP
ncbi:MAG: hypothetical protein HY093_03800 [Candidatus Liptonbacteria bacterium]|nr:hypothetical protein [Candidatus Liptonbacteria bacterium]